MSLASVPVLGPLGEYFSSGPFREFDLAHISGLAHCPHRGRVDILSIYVYPPERGKHHASKLIDDCMREYDTVCVWVIESAIVRAMLTRRGFSSGIDPRTEDDYMIWHRA
jgi:hypothetical protein